ncbi:MAG: inorganic diphosphatase [Acidobacteriota bacterium]|nr:inorganic diphosphatase [Acidobacteriota bacterium]
MARRNRRALSSGEDLPPFAENGKILHAIVDTPKGSRNKFKWDEERKLYKLAGVLPAGAVFPFDFGYVPSTEGEDGDALDVLLLMDEPAFVGCLVETRLIGVIEARQTEDGKTERNDRLIAVAEASRTHKAIEELADLPENLLHEIEHFFVSYNAAKGKQFEPIGRAGSRAARRLVAQGSKRAQPRSSASRNKGKKSS